MATPAQKWINAQSDIWETGAAPEGEFTLLPVGVPPLITTAQEIVLGTDPNNGQEGYSTSGQNWSPKPLTAPYGILQSGEDFFPFYRNGTFWTIREIQSMRMNGLLIDSANPNHAPCFRKPSETTLGFYQITLFSAIPSSTFNSITGLVSGNTLALTEITLSIS